MKDYKLTIEDGVITWVENTDGSGNPIPGRLFIPKEVIAFDADAWVFLGCEADAIVVDPENDVFSSAHNCLLSKDGKKLIKVCKNSDVSKLTSLEIIGQDAFNDLNVERNEFVFRIPRGVKILDYRAFAINARNVEIVVPSSARAIGALAFTIHSDSTHIVFEGDAELEVGAFGTELEAKDSDIEAYNSMPSILYPKKEKLTVTCPKESNVSSYCKKYEITEVK
jgi:hypothetical protein